MTAIYNLLLTLFSFSVKDMASSPLNRKTSYHSRSISLPSRFHPLTLKVEEQLCRLRSSKTTSSSCSSSSRFSSLTGLKYFYECVDDLLQLPLTQQALAHERSHNCIDEAQKGSLQMSDVCSASRDILSRTKECTQDLRSSLRRKGGEVYLENEVGLYMKSRKEVCKVVQKCLVDINKTENKPVFSSLVEMTNHKLVAIIAMVREVEAVTLSMSKALLVSISRSQSRQTGWSLVSKLMNNKRITCQGEEADNSQMEKVDVALSSLLNNKSCKRILVQNAQKQLEALEFSIQGFEDELECIYKSLIKTRFTFLNILSQ